MPSKRKRAAKGVQKKSSHKEASFSGFPVLSLLRRIPFITSLLTFAVFLCLGTFLLERWMVGLSWVAFSVCLLMAWRVRLEPDPPFKPLYILAWIGGVGLTLYGFLAIPAMTSQLPWVPSFHALQPWPSSMAGLCLVGLAYGGFRERSGKISELSAWVTGAWLILILGVAAWMRLKNCWDPWPGYGFDSAVSMIVSHTALDFADERFLIFPYSAQPPFYEYLIALGFWFFPHVSSIAMQKIIWALIDLAAVGFHYLLGRELGGRRTGLLLAAAIVLSKPMLVLCMSTMNPVTVPLTMGVFMYFTVRYFRTPDLKNAILWGAAVAFGAYTIAYLRPFLWGCPVAVMAFTLWRYRSCRDRWYWIAGLGVTLLWTYLFFFLNDFIPKSLKVDPWVIKATLVLFALVVYKVKREAGRSTPHQALFTTLSGVFVAGLLLYPIVTHPLFSGYPASYSIFNSEHPEYQKITPHLLLERFKFVFDALFTDSPDDGSFNFAGEAFFSLTSIPWVLVGLAWWFVRPGWKGTFVLFCFGLAAVPHYMSQHSHGGRLGGMMTPLLLLGAIGVDLFWRELESLKGARLWSLLFLLLLGAYSWWAVGTLNYRFDVIWPQQTNSKVAIFKEVRLDAPSHRLYLWDDDAWMSFFTMSAMVDEGYDVYVIDPKGAEVPVVAGKKPQDVVVYLNGANEKILKKMMKNFPSAKRKDVFLPSQSSKDLPLLVKLYIDGNDLRWGQPFGKLFFQRVKVDENSWRCRSYKFRNGLSRAVIRREDWLTGALGPLPNPAPVETVQADGVIHVPQDGKYDFSVAGGNFAVMTVDGERVLNYRPRFGKPSKGEAGTIRLKAGEHRVVLWTYLQMGLNLPEIKVRFPGGTEDHLLGTF